MACVRAWSRLGAPVVAVAIAVWLGVSCGRGSEVAPARNLVLIVVDTLRADQTSLSGYARDTTPFLKRFQTQRAVQFDQARATSSWTKPSVASLLTGLDPRHHQVKLHTDSLCASLPTLAEVLAKQGFATAAVQSNMYLFGKFGFARGFAQYFDGEDTIATHERPSTGARVNEVALQWLDQRPQDQRFFLYVHHYEPHHPYVRSGEAYDPGYAGRLTGSESMDELVGATAQLGAEDAEFLRARYDAEVRYQDELLEQLIAGLEARGLLESTAIVITADHGEEFLEHGDLSHQYKMYDELVHVPLLVARPGDARKGAHVPEAVSLVDLGRTLLDLAGLYSASFPGESLIPFLDGDKQEQREIHAQAVFRERLPGAAEERAHERDLVLVGHHKLIRDLTLGTTELYDLRRDPKERLNLAAQQPERAAELRGRCEAFLRERSALEAPCPAAPPIELTPDEQRRLKALGYGG